MININHSPCSKYKKNCNQRSKISLKWTYEADKQRYFDRLWIKVELTEGSRDLGIKFRHETLLI